MNREEHTWQKKKKIVKKELSLAEGYFVSCDPLDVVQACGWWNDWSGSGNGVKKGHQSWEKIKEFGEVEGAMKGKRFDQLSLCSLGQLGSLAREIWERIRFQFWTFHSIYVNLNTWVSFRVFIDEGSLLFKLP